MLDINTLSRLGRKTLRLAMTFPEYRRNETVLHGVLLGLLEGEVGMMGREKRTTYGRIDFRHGGSNPAVIELAIRDAYNSNQLYGSQNSAELNKLCRVPHERARLRALLLLDSSNSAPIPKSKLKATYDKVTSSPGKFERSSIRVIYVHPDLDYDFLWKA
jgi:hypothetical protein